MIRGFRLIGILVVLFLIAGCTQDCVRERELKEDAITNTKQLYSKEAYTVSENKIVGEECIEKEYTNTKGEAVDDDSKFNLSMEDAEWIETPPVFGESNHVRRVVKVHNGKDEIDTVWLDKVYLYNGTEIKRSKNPMKFLIEPKSVRQLYFMWDTQYDPLKDVIAEFSNVTGQEIETEIVKICYNKTEKVDVTKYRDVMSGTENEIVGYDSRVRVKLKNGC